MSTPEQVDNFTARDDNQQSDDYVFNTPESQADLVAEAFSDDDLIDEFKADKAKEEEASKPEDQDDYLPGWGGWAGPGIADNERKRARLKRKAPEMPQRKDKAMPGVIINEAEDVSLKKFQVSEIPFPFTSVRAFEASIRHPTGKEWNSQLAHKRLIEPAVTIKAGRPIDPMSKQVKGHSGKIWDKGTAESSSDSE